MDQTLNYPEDEEVSGSLAPAISVCVYCSSSNAVSREYRDLASAVGEALGAAGWHLIYGGTRIGLMGDVASAARRTGGQVTGIVPGHIRDRVPECEQADSLVVTVDMRERKALMEQHADAFLALPGGFGTLEEVMEILTRKQLGLHAKPVVFLNADDFYSPLLSFFENLYSQGFARREYAGLYRIANSVAETMDALRETLCNPVTAGFLSDGDKWR
jgi:cytokinin riboside 5'-monophosphate phosphoribohydrolase